MKNIFLFVMLIPVLKTNSQYKFVLAGTTSGEFNNQKIVLQIRDSYSDNRYTIRDTAIISNNKFSFSGEINKPCEWAEVYTKSGFYYFALDTGANVISVNPVPKNSPTFKNKLSNSNVRNSDNNTVYRNLYELFSNYYLKYAKPADENKAILVLDEKRKNELYRKEMEFLQHNPAVYYSLIHLYEIFNRINRNIPEIESVFQKLSTGLQVSLLGTELNMKIQEAKKLLIGQKVLSFTVPELSGSVFSSALLEGKPYLLAFGATWCIPCKKNYPLLNKIYQENKAKGFEIVSVNLDADRKKWEEQILSYNLNWINVSELVEWEKSKISKLFDVRALPFYLLIDKNGVIVYNSFQLDDIEGRQLKKYIDSILN